MTVLFVIGGIIIIQIIVMLVIIIVLWRVLNRQLVELAIEKFELFSKDGWTQEQNQLEVIVASNIDKVFEQKLVKAVQKKLNKPVSIAVKQDRSIKGGMIMYLKNGTVIDYSLRSRLKESGLLGKFFGSS